MAQRSDDSFIDGFADAFRASNVFLRVTMFIVFGLVTATPYLIYNLDMAPSIVEETGASGIGAAWVWFKALMSATWTGMFIGLSTVANTVMSFAKGDFPGWATTVFSGLVFLFATLTVFQPTRLFFNAIDMQKGRKHPAWQIYMISAVVVAVVLSPVAFWVNDGDTITSGVKDAYVDDLNSSVSDSLFINGTDESSDGDLVSTIDMLTGG